MKELPAQRLLTQSGIRPVSGARLVPISTMKNEALELELIARAFQTISKETGYQGVAEALLSEALSYGRIARGAAGGTTPRLSTRRSGPHDA